jgi:hypothetical protein
MGLRLFDDQQTLGGLNMYSTAAVEIDADVLHIAELFASHAALALGKARIEGNMTAGMENPQRIGQAAGILREWYELDEVRAFGYLTRVSQTSNLKLRDIAEELVTTLNDRNRGTRGAAPRGLLFVVVVIGRRAAHDTVVLKRRARAWAEDWPAAARASAKRE